MINKKVKQFLFNNYIVLLLMTIVFVVGAFIFSARTREDLNLLLVTLGGIASFFYFIQKQQVEELNLFTELYRTFNKRYDDKQVDSKE